MTINQSINQSIRLYTDFQTRRIPEQFRFVRENALSSRCLSTLTPFQVIVVRHPNISECNTFETALKFIDPEGLIIITTFQDYERDLVVESLEKNGCNITVNTENIWARPIDNDALMERNGLMIDKHIIMAIAGCPQRRQ